MAIEKRIVPSGRKNDLKEVIRDYVDQLNGENLSNFSEKTLGNIAACLHNAMEFVRKGDTKIKVIQTNKNVFEK